MGIPPGHLFRTADVHTETRSPCTCFVQVLACLHFLLLHQGVFLGDPDATPCMFLVFHDVLHKSVFALAPFHLTAVCRHIIFL